MTSKTLVTLITANILFNSLFLVFPTTNYETTDLKEIPTFPEAIIPEKIRMKMRQYSYLLPKVL